MEISHSSTDPAQLAPFLRTLLETGEVAVRRWTKQHATLHDMGAAEVLRELDAAARDELSGPAPVLDEAAALWAARQLYRACQAVLCRDLPAGEVAGLLGTPCPSPRNPATNFSVDLTFRHLPELHRLTHRLAPGDALVGILQRWAHEWPLSGVGVERNRNREAPADAPALESFADDPTLWRLFLDRIAVREDFDRLSDPRVRTALAVDLGAHAALAPALHSALQRASAPAPSSPAAANTTGAAT